MEPPPRRLISHARGAGHHVGGAGVETARALAFDRDRDTVGLVVDDLVVEAERQAQHIESWPQIG